MIKGATKIAIVYIIVGVLWILVSDSLLSGANSDFWQNVKVTGSANELNPELDKAFRVADFIELGQLMAMDALNRKESCGGHFRWDHATPEGEAERDDENYKFVSAWEYQGMDIKQEVIHKEDLVYENIEVKTRSYK